MSRLAVIPPADRFQWGPIPAKPYYLILSAIPFVIGAKVKYGLSWPESYLFLFEGDKGLWYSWQSELGSYGWRAAKLVYGPGGRLRHLPRAYQQRVSALAQACQRVRRVALERANDQQICSLYRLVTNAYEHFCEVSIFPELIGYGLSAYLQRQTPRYFSGEELTNALTVLTSASAPTFYQQEELALLRILGRLNQRWFSQSAHGGVEKLSRYLQQRQPKVWIDLQRHAAEYDWLLNNYAGAQQLGIEWFLERAQAILASQESPTDQQQMIRKQFKENERLRQTFLEKLPASVRRYAAACGSAVTWHDDRKSWQLRTHGALHRLLAEFARRRGAALDDLLHLLPEELECSIEGKLHLEDVDVTARRELCLFHITPQRWQFLTGPSAERLFRSYRRTAKTAAAQVHGIVASKGKSETVRGIARILYRPQDGVKVKSGDILIAELTSPDYIMAIKRAGALVTDAGGLTSHAAVVARELGIACVVGTKSATAAFRDGEMVELDVMKGVVRVVGN